MVKTIYPWLPNDYLSMDISDIPIISIEKKHAG